MTTISSETLHASCVAIGGRAVLIEGPSGSGKSDLALRLIDRGAKLVADDYTILTREDGALKASPPPTIAGRIEVRAIGIVDMPHVDRAPAALLVRLVGRPARMPADDSDRLIPGIVIPEIYHHPHDAPAPTTSERPLA